MNKITIIDGNSLLFRAYYATAFPGVEIMRSSDGTPTNAIFAFSNMINKIISEVKPGEGLFVAFDAGKHNFRHDQLQTYKANRKPAPDDLVLQFPLVRTFLKSMNIYQFEEEGFEGDDIAGSVAKLAEKNNWEVHLYTSDRDFLQLVNDNIYVHILKKGLSDVMIMTPQLVLDTYGFKPLQIIDYKGLRGDSSDNLPGIPGVGEKTAVKLIQEYGSFDKIIENANNIKGKLGETIKNNADIGRISRDLAIIKTDIDLPFSLQDTIYQGYSFTDINEFCQKYGFKQFINKVNPKWKKQENSHIDIKYKEVKTLQGYDIHNIGISLDYEDENDYTNSHIFGIAFSFDNTNLYMNIDDVKNDEYAINILKDKNVLKYCYDYKAIKVALNNYQIKIDGLYFDLMIAAYLLDSSLKNDVLSILHFFGKDINEEADQMSLLSSSNPLKTCSIAYSIPLLNKTAIEELKKISAYDLYTNLEIPLVDTLADMEIEGFPLDCDLLDTFGKEFQEKADALQKEIFTMAGCEFNLSSPKQIGEILYNKLGLSQNKKMSTSFETLKEIRHEHPIIDKLLEYRKYFKLISTYINGLKNHIHKDGKIHAKFNQALTTTGRLSSSDPNLQNISIRDEESKLIRKAFHYPNSEYEILSLDYSQIELRVLASLSNCKSLQDVFNNHKDIHKETAKKIFNLLEEPNESQRRKAKTVNFGIVYGISDWGLADELGISIYEAKDLIKTFYLNYPEVSDFFKNIVENATKDGFVSTILGRRRYLRELNDSNYQVREFAKRAAVNAPIQGSAADLIKISMINVSKLLKESGLETKMVLQIHDELIFKVPVNEKEKAYTLIKTVMENALKLEVNLEVDGGFGKDWYSAK